MISIKNIRYIVDNIASCDVCLNSCVVGWVIYCKDSDSMIYMRDSGVNTNSSVNYVLEMQSEELFREWLIEQILLE
jgi:hypothetical protein